MSTPSFAGDTVHVVRDGIVEIAVAESGVARRLAANRRRRSTTLPSRTAAPGVRGIVDHLARPAPGLHHRVECLEVLAGLLELALLDALG